jgi:SnoaL-like domain
VTESDRDLIANHLARYCFVVDRDSAEAIAALFWEDARLEFNGTYVGREAIRQCYAEWIRTARDPVEGLRHMIYVPLIAINGDEATAETYVDTDAHSRKSGRTILLRSLYRDRLHRRHGEWRFAERHIVPMRRLYDTERESRL